MDAVNTNTDIANAAGAPRSAATADATAAPAAAHTAAAAQQATPDSIKAVITKAESGFTSARKNTVNAAAALYHAWYHCWSPERSQVNNHWLVTAIDERSKEIEAFNDAIAAQRKAANKDYKAAHGELETKRDEANHIDTRNVYEQQIKQLEIDHDQRMKELTAKRWIKLETPTAQNISTTLSRFVLRLNEQNSRSTVHRFGMVLRWLIAQANTIAKGDFSVAAKELERIGFDNAYEAQRKLEDKKDGKENATAATKGTEPGVRADVARHFNDQLAKSVALASVSVTGAAPAGQFVSLIGRVDGDAISVVGRIDTPVDEIFDLAVRYGEVTLLPSDPAAEFIATAFELSTLVETNEKEGEATAKNASAATRGSDTTTDTEAKAAAPGKVKGKTSGDTDAKVLRHTTIVVKEAPYLLLSSVGAKANFVIHAEPRGEAAQLFPSEGCWAPFDAQHDTIAGVVSDAVVRKVVTVRRDDVEKQLPPDFVISDFGWEANNKALGSSTTCRWLRMSCGGEPPLEINSFTPSASGTVGCEEVRKLVDGNIGNKANKSPNKANKVCTVKFEQGVISVCNQSDTDTMHCAGHAPGAATAFVRTVMLHQLVMTLAKVSTAQFAWSIDKHGALRVSFSTAFGNYSIYLPTCDASGVLETRRFASLDI